MILRQRPFSWPRSRTAAEAFGPRNSRPEALSAAAVAPTRRFPESVLAILLLALSPAQCRLLLVQGLLYRAKLGEATLSDVVEFYREGGVPNEELDPLMSPLELSDTDVADLVAFLEALTGSDVDALIADAFAVPVGDVGQTH